MKRINKGRIVVVVVYVMFILLAYFMVNAHVKAWNGDDSKTNAVIAIVLTLVFLALLIFILATPGFIP